MQQKAISSTKFQRKLARKNCSACVGHMVTNVLGVSTSKPIFIVLVTCTNARLAVIRYL